MTDITELAQSLKAAAENATPGEWCSDDQYGVVADAGLNGNYYIASCSGPEHRSNKRFIALANPANILALVEALEKAQQERDNWRTSFDNERFRADKLKAHIDDIEPIRAAAEKLVRCKGRYHSELNYRALAALFGVTTPDLPPLEHENVHYADTADMEIAALRQRIAELESRTVTVKLPQAVSAGGQGYQAQVERILTAAGIKVEAE